MADLLSVREVEFVAIDSIENQILEVDGDKISIVETNPQIIEVASTAVDILVTNDPQNIVFTSDPISFISDNAAPSVGLTIYDEGGLVARNVTELNFAGQQVLAK